MNQQRIRFVRKIAARSALLLIAALPACALAGGGESPSGEDARRRALEYAITALNEGNYAAASERLATVAAICPVDAPGRRAMLLLATAELDGRNPNARPDAAAALAGFQLARNDESWERSLAAELYTIALDFGADAIAAEDVPDARIIWTLYLGDDGQAMADTPLGMDADDAQAAAALAPGPVASRSDATEAEANAAAARRVSDAVEAIEAGPRCDVPGPRADLVMPELDGTPLAHQRTPAPQPSGAGRAAALSDDVRALQAEIQRLRGELAEKDQELDRIRRTLRP